MVRDIGFVNAFNYKVIYIITINDEFHKGLVKIGDASLVTSKPIEELPPNCKELNQAALKRIKNYTNTAGVNAELLHTELAIKQVKNKDNIIITKAFRDYDVHRVLEQSGIKKAQIIGTTGKEWYPIDKELAVEAIKAVKNNYGNLSNTSVETFIPIVFRPEQKEAIERTVRHFKNNTRMLWNAKMRFGKTLCALEVVKECKFKKTIIVTHRPVVNDGWYEDFHKIFQGLNYVYGSKQNGNSINDLLEKDINFVYFASMQDLRGSDIVGGKIGKNREIFSTVWDCVIVDEAHEGTQTTLGDDTIKAIVKDDKDTRFLALSGTPFNILNTFNSQEIYTWDYIMEQEKKSEWDELYFGDSNPYEELPELRIYTYDLGDLSRESKFITYEDKAFNFGEFFRTWTGDYKRDFAQMPASAEVGDFVHEQDLISFLNLLVKQDSNNNYPYSTEEYRKLFRHSLWMVPGVKEAKALKKLMLKHPVFGQGFEIINVAGNNDEEAVDALNSVKSAIKRAELEDGYTITLSCGKLTTGVTIKEWTAVFMLAGSYSTSASNYLQTIFRVQSPCNKNGQMKDIAYVFDFAPDRTLKMVSEAVSVSSKAGRTKDEDKILLGKFLNYCPVISVEGSKMSKYETPRLLQELKKAYAERVVLHGFDDSNLYNDKLLKLSEVEIEKFNELKKVIGTSAANPTSREVDINRQGLTEEEFEKIREIEKKKKKDRTQEEQQQLEELKKCRENRKNAISILRSISIRMPLLIYGVNVSDDKEITLDSFMDQIDEASWEEFMPQDVTKEKFSEFKKYYDEDVFIAAGHRIRSIAREADNLSPTERTKKIAELFSFFKNPDKETVLTPWRVVNMHMSDTLGGYNFFDEKHETLLDEPRFISRGNVTMETLCNSNGRVLEINSKTGLYPLYIAYSFFREKARAYNDSEFNLDLQWQVWNEVLKQNVYVICKTPMAKQITQRTLAGYTDVKINAHYFDDLEKAMKEKSKQFIDRVLKLSYWKKDENGKMKFDAIVGNPPYQKNISSEGKNSSLSKQLFPSFVQTTIQMQAKYVSLVTPSRWFTGDAQDKSFVKLREFLVSNNHFRKIFNYPDNRMLFKGVEIAGGVNYYLYDSSYVGEVQFIERYEDKENVLLRPLFEDGLDIVISLNSSVDILNKVRSQEDFISLTTITSGRNAYGIVGKSSELSKITKEQYFEGAISVRCAYEKILYTARENVIKNTQDIDRWKVFTSKGNGGAGMLSDNKSVAILGKAYIGKPLEVCTDSLIPIGSFNNEQEAINLQKYMSTKFLRFMVGILKTSQNVYQNVYRFVPMQNFTNQSDIDWNCKISEIDKQLYIKYGLVENEILLIEEKIKAMD